MGSYSGNGLNLYTVVVVKGLGACVCPQGRSQPLSGSLGAPLIEDMLRFVSRPFLAPKNHCVFPWLVAYTTFFE